MLSILFVCYLIDICLFCRFIRVQSRDVSKNPPEVDTRRINKPTNLIESLLIGTGSITTTRRAASVTLAHFVLALQTST